MYDAWSDETVERQRRSGDRRTRPTWRRRHLAARLSAGDGMHPDPVRVGRLLLAACGFTTLVMTPWLTPDEPTLAIVAAVSVAMSGLLVASFRLPWDRWSPRAALVFPAAVAVALAAMSIRTPGFVAPLSGLLTLCFAHIGLTQRPGTAAFAVLPAGAAFVYLNDGWTSAIGIRMVIALLVWFLLAEMLAGLTVRQARLAARLNAAAHTDVLTGIGNRRDLQARLAASVPGDTVVMCDLDNFKRLNDTRGHAAGDTVLADFGALLRLTLRGQDYCARMGGEEFLLLLHDTDVDGAVRLLARMRQHWATVQPDVTFSTGIARLRADQTPGAAVALADSALYAAKDAGRNTDRWPGYRAERRSPVLPVDRARRSIPA